MKYTFSSSQAESYFFVDKIVECYFSWAFLWSSSCALLDFSKNRVSIVLSWKFNDLTDKLSLTLS